MTTTNGATRTETFQIPIEVAERYEAMFVPGLFAEWAPRLADIAGIRPGQAVLDVACGTGIVARTVADQLGDRGRVVGVDVNDAMLAVARRVGPQLDWRRADVAALPFSDGEFDAALCQMALMFFADRIGALREMGRVVRPGGVVALAVPAALDDQPAYGPFVELAVREAGPAARSLLDTYWRCGDLDELIAGVREAGLEPIASETHVGTARFAAVDGLAEAEITASPLDERIPGDVRRRIVEETRTILRPWTAADGTLHAPLHGHLVVGRVR
jgi:ubiquinone/menaquinone biosynthesis C-methylase UbiE